MSGNGTLPAAGTSGTSPADNACDYRGAPAGGPPTALAYGTVVACNAALVLAYLSYVALLATRPDSGLRGLVIAASVITSAVAFAVSVAIGAGAVAVMSRRPWWRPAITSGPRAMLAGAAAAAIGVAPFALLFLYGELTTRL